MTTATPIEKAFDRLLSLYLIHNASQQVENFGNTKLQKFTFLSEWKMINKRDKGFNYYYLRCKKGPFSFELADDLKIFKDAAIVRQIGYDIILTKYGKCILEDFSNIFEQNKLTISIIDKTIEKFADYNLEELLDAVYALPHPYVSGYTIGSSKIKMPLLYPLPDKKVICPISLSKEQTEDLMINLGKNGLKHWLAVREDMRNPECLSYKEVFGNC